MAAKPAPREHANAAAEGTDAREGTQPSPLTSATTTVASRRPIQQPTASTAVPVDGTRARRDRAAAMARCRTTSRALGAADGDDVVAADRRCQSQPDARCAHATTPIDARSARADAIGADADRPASAPMLAAALAEATRAADAVPHRSGAEARIDALASTLGASPSSPAGEVRAATAPTELALPTPIDSPDFGAAFGVQVSVLAKDGVQQAELHLNPAETGPVSIQIAVDGSEARIDFGADLAATRAAIETQPARAGGGAARRRPDAHRRRRLAARRRPRAVAATTRGSPAARAGMRSSSGRTLTRRRCARCTASPPAASTSTPEARGERRAVWARKAALIAASRQAPVSIISLTARQLRIRRWRCREPAPTPARRSFDVRSDRRPRCRRRADAARQEEAHRHDGGGPGARARARRRRGGLPEAARGARRRGAPLEDEATPRTRERAADRSEERADLPAARPVRRQPGRQGGRPLRPDRHHPRARHRRLGRPDQGLHAGDPQRDPDGAREQERQGPDEPRRQGAAGPGNHARGGAADGHRGRGAGADHGGAGRRRERAQSLSRAPSRAAAEADQAAPSAATDRAIPIQHVHFSSFIIQ